MPRDPHIEAPAQLRGLFSEIVCSLEMLGMEFLGPVPVFAEVLEDGLRLLLDASNGLLYLYDAGFQVVHVSITKSLYSWSSIPVEVLLQELSPAAILVEVQLPVFWIDVVFGKVDGDAVGMPHPPSEMTLVNDRFLAPGSQTPKQFTCLFLYASMPAPALEQPGKTVKVDVVVIEEFRAILPGRDDGSEDLVVIDRTDKLMRETIQVSHHIIHFPEVQARLGDVLHTTGGQVLPLPR